MSFESKYNVGDVIYYPSSEARRALVLRDEIKGVIFSDMGVKYFTTISNYGIDEADIFTSVDGARDRLIEILKEQKEATIKEIDEISEKILNAKEDELVKDIYAEAHAEEVTETTK